MEITIVTTAKTDEEGREMEITIVTTAKTDEEGRELLGLLGMPFKRP